MMTQMEKAYYEKRGKLLVENLKKRHLLLFLRQFPV